MDCRLFWLSFNGILAYELLCPAELHRKLRAEIVCDGNSTEQYSCFLDQFSKTYKESCKDTSDFVRPGKKYVIGVFRKNTDCDLWRFQPFKFWSHQLSKCVFSKSRCKDNGQIMHSLGSTFGDSVCRCDHRKGYAFLKNTTDPCFCKPSEEDCTCYIKICPPNYRLTPDYECKLSLSEKSNCPDVQSISDTTKTTNKPFDVKDMKLITTTIGSYRSTILYTIPIILVAVLSILCFFGVFIKRQKEKLKLREDDGLQISQITTVDQQRRTLTSSDDIPHDEAALNVGEFKPELILEVNTNYRCKTEFNEESNGAVNDICLQSTQITTVNQSIDQQTRTLPSPDDIPHDEAALNVGEFKPDLIQERKTNHQRKTEWFEKKEKETEEMSQSEAINSKKSFVVAIAFGTTYSGYAFSSKSTPNDIFTCSWQKSTLVSMKAPTSVLLDKEKNFVAFGFEAETKYFNSLENDDSDDEDGLPKDVYHYFYRFTMMLHKKSFNFDTTIKDQNGIQMKAFEIYSFSIKYMKDQVIRRLVDSFKSVELKDIHYVLIVPDIWDYESKETIRKAAEKAGIKDKNFKIAVGPESALIYCQTYRDQYNDKPFSRLMTGSKYVVVNLGGSTAYISVHERQLDYSFKEVMLPRKVEWGGTSVDKAFLAFANSVFTRKVIKELHSDEQEDYTMLFHEFEVKKRTITSEYSTDIVIALPVSLLEITQKHCTSVPAAIQRSRFKEYVSFKGQNIYVKPAAFRQLFKPTINSIIKNLDELLKHPNFSDLQHIIMVGGFSECELVQTAMRQKFPRKKIIIPDETGLTVLKGAVLLGHQLVSL